ncbi:DEAD/DEAH box helicase [Oerskovia sp. M15]
MDHLERRSLVLDDIRYLVLDEADEMLRMGFAEDVEKIFGQAPRSARSPCSPRRCRPRSVAWPPST